MSRFQIITARSSGFVSIRRRLSFASPIMIPEKEATPSSTRPKMWEEPEKYALG